MPSSGITRRQLLAASGAIGATGFGLLGYASDNPIHRSSVKRTATRQVSHTPDPGALWAADFQFGDRLSTMDLTQLIGVQYRGRASGDNLLFDVIGVTIKKDESGADGQPLHRHWLSVSGSEEVGLIMYFTGKGNNIQGGILVPPAVLAENLPVERTQLDNSSVVRDLIRRGMFTGRSRWHPKDDVKGDFRLVDTLLNRRSPERHDRLTRAGLLYALYKEQTTAWHGGEDVEPVGNRYRWDLDNVTAHVVRYRGVEVIPADNTFRLNIAQSIPRPSMLGDPTAKSTLAIEISP